MVRKQTGSNGKLPQGELEFPVAKKEKTQTSKTRGSCKKGDKEKSGSPCPAKRKLRFTGKLKGNQIGGGKKGEKGSAYPGEKKREEKS